MTTTQNWAILVFGNAFAPIVTFNDHAKAEAAFRQAIKDYPNGQIELRYYIDDNGFMRIAIEQEYANGKISRYTVEDQLYPEYKDTMET